MPEVVCFTLPYRSASFERALQGIKQAGYDAIGFGLSHADGDYPAERTVQEADRIKKILDTYSLRPRILYGSGPEKASVEDLCAWIDFAHALDRAMLVWVGTWGYVRFPDEPLPAEELERRHQAYVEKLRQVAAYAEDKDVTITLKPHTGNTATGPILAKTLKEIDSKVVKACLDPGNVSFYEGISPEEDAEVLLSETVALTMKDHRGPRANRDFPIPGEGDIDWVRILKGLKEHGFDGPLMVERIDGTDGSNISLEEIDARIARARENTVRMAKEAGFDL